MDDGPFRSNRLARICFLLEATLTIKYHEYTFMNVKKCKKTKNKNKKNPVVDDGPSGQISCKRAGKYLYCAQNVKTVRLCTAFNKTMI